MRATALYKKAAAALLLVVLLLTTFVQLTHSHVTKSGFAAQLKKAVTLNEITAAQGNDSNCFICDYQLTKDADSFFGAVYIINGNSLLTTNDTCINPEPLDVLTHFETRGPPSFFTAA